MGRTRSPYAERKIIGWKKAHVDNRGLDYAIRAGVHTK